MNWRWPMLTPKEVPTSGPASFGYVRRHHTHEGVDLLTTGPQTVFAMEDCEVVRVCQFTGPEVGSPWWLPTWCVMAEGPSGLVVYGELGTLFLAREGDRVRQGDSLGSLTRVLRHEKGYPTTMLHLELRKAGHTELFDWKLGEPKPDWLLDPTPFLLEAKP